MFLLRDKCLPALTHHLPPPQSLEVLPRTDQGFLIRQNLPFLTGMKCLDNCPSVAARNCQISSLYESSQVSAVGLCQQPTVSQLEKSLITQLMSEDFGLSIFPSALNLDRVFLTVDRDTKEVLSVCITDCLCSTDCAWFHCLFCFVFRSYQQMIKPASSLIVALVS